MLITNCLANLVQEFYHNYLFPTYISGKKKKTPDTQPLQVF